MEKIDKRQWLEGLVLMAISSTISKTEKEEREEHKFNVAEKVADIILEQFNDESIFK